MISIKKLLSGWSLHSLQARFRILPKSKYTLTFNLWPVTTGLVPLPALDLLHQREGEGQRESHPVISTLPDSIFIKPAPLVRVDSVSNAL